MTANADTPNNRDELFGWRDTKSPDYAPKTFGLPVREESIVQLGPGEFAADVQMATVDDIGLLLVGIGVESVGVSVFNPDCTGFALPVSWTGDYFVNGDPANPSNLYMPGDLDSFHQRSQSRVTLGVTVPRQPLIKTIAALRGVSIEDVTLNDRELRLGDAAGAQVRARLAAIIGEACGDRVKRSPREIHNDVFALLTDAYLCARPESRSQAEWIRRPERIVRLAEERFMESRGEPVSLADLCAAAGVSKSTLYPAFQSVCGQPPLAYFQKRRLTRARSILFNAEPARGQVKQAALHLGFTELGRFSVEYRRLFGESPSATLNRSAA